MSSSSAFADHQHHHQQLYTHNPSDQLCYVRCDNCDTVLAVSVPSTSLFKTVAVRCGHCSNLLTVTMRGYVLPSVNLGHSFFPPAPQNNHHLLPEEDEISRVSQSNMMLNPNMPLNVMDDLPKPPSLPNRPPEKRQRVPSAYNRFIKDEIQRIKAGNPDISHREAFSAAAKNWAHFPHIHFGLMSEQPVKKQNVCQQEGDDGVMNMRDYNIGSGGGGFLAAPAHIGLSPY